MITHHVQHINKAFRQEVALSIHNQFEMYKLPQMDVQLIFRFALGDHEANTNDEVILAFEYVQETYQVATPCIEKIIDNYVEEKTLEPALVRAIRENLTRDDANDSLKRLGHP